MADAAKPLHALTGLRWIAAFAVFLHHLQRPFGVPYLNWWLGSLAVSFFFVLSGFILTYVYAERMANKTVTVRKFLFTRWARIWPLHLACLVIFVTVFSSWNAILGSWDHTPRFLTNLTMLQSWVPDPGWYFGFNGVSWSISTEFFFYLAFPFLMIGGEKKFWPIFVILTLSGFGDFVWSVLRRKDACVRRLGRRQYGAFQSRCFDCLSFVRAWPSGSCF